MSHTDHMDRAVGLIAQIARIPDLADGWLSFRLHDLGAMRWHDSEDYDDPAGERIWLPKIPAGNQDDDALRADARRMIELAIKHNAQELYEQAQARLGG